MKTILLTLTLLLLGTSFIGIIDYVFFSQKYQDYSYMPTFLLYMAIGGFTSLFFLIRLNKKKPALKEQTICQKALSILEAIPSDKFITGLFASTLDPTKGCASGHLMGRLDGGNYPSWGRSEKSSEFDRELRKVTRDYLQGQTSLVTYDTYVSVNNAPSSRYPQDNPKDRVIALLKDCVKAGL